MPKYSDAEILKLQKKYRTDTGIAKALGISRQAVHQQRQKKGIAPLRVPTEERDAAIVSDYASGLSGIAIADKMGLSISTVYRVIKESKVKRGSKKKR